MMAIFPMRKIAQSQVDSCAIGKALTETAPAGSMADMPLPGPVRFFVLFMDAKAVGFS